MPNPSSLLVILLISSFYATFTHACDDSIPPITGTYFLEGDSYQIQYQPTPSNPSVSSTATCTPAVYTRSYYWDASNRYSSYSWAGQACDPVVTVVSGVYYGTSAHGHSYVWGNATLPTTSFTTAIFTATWPTPVTVD